MTRTNKQVRLATRPVGWVKESDFNIVESPLPEVGAGQLLVKNIYLSLDPYMRGRMSDAKSYATKMEIGDVMVGSTVGEVVASQRDGFVAGDLVLGYFGWQQYGLSDGKGLLKIDRGKLPPSAYLGAVGMPGITAWYGLEVIGQPKPGETVVVSAAAGAVGSVVGQLAQLKGCRAVGIAGGRAKCDLVVKELGFAACVDYKAGDVYEQLRAATPKGIDVYFDNVGGEIFESVLRLLNPFARIPLCGMISQYNESNSAELRGPRNFASLLVNRALLQGFIVSDHMERWPEALAQLGPLVASGKIKYRETIAEGIERAPAAFIGLLKGENVGKQLVKLA